MLVRLDSCSSADDRPSPTSGAGWQRWNRADIDLNSRRKSLRNFKYESSSSPGTPPGQEELRPWALSATPSSREAIRMADERPPILVQLATEYFMNGSSCELVESVSLMIYNIHVLMRWFEDDWYIHRRPVSELMIGLPFTWYPSSTNLIWVFWELFSNLKADTFSI